MLGEAQSASQPVPRPSIFLSYASADRGAARTLRDTLEIAGLDVWLDEDELGGGEAWDTKIRNQIRSCTYFMPVISATTEVRGEGYFRREWRLAVERTLDLADDILFLVPVVIDDTRDSGARVPEKFFSVQWLRVPEGKSTAALEGLARRLAEGDAVAPPPAAASPARPSTRPRKKDRAVENVTPPFPNFPSFPEHGHRLRFFYNLALWGGHVLLSFWGHMPRFFRMVAAMVIIFNLIAWAFRESKSASHPPDQITAPAAAGANEIVIGGHTLSQAEKDTAAGTIEAVVGAVTRTLQSDRSITLINFSGKGEHAEALAERVFNQVLTALKEHENSAVSVSPIPINADATDAEILDHGTRFKSQFVLCGFARGATPSHPRSFIAKLYDVKLAKLIWTETYDSPPNDAVSIVRHLATELEQRTAPAKPAE